MEGRAICSFGKNWYQRAALCGRLALSKFVPRAENSHAQRTAQGEYNVASEESQLIFPAFERVRIAQRRLVSLTCLAWKREPLVNSLSMPWFNSFVARHKVTSPLHLCTRQSGLHNWWWISACRAGFYNSRFFLLLSQRLYMSVWWWW